MRGMYCPAPHIAGHGSDMLLLLSVSYLVIQQQTFNMTIRQPKGGGRTSHLIRTTMASALKQPSLDGHPLPVNHVRRERWERWSS